MKEQGIVHDLSCPSWINLPRLLSIQANVCDAQSVPHFHAQAHADADRQFTLERGDHGPLHGRWRHWNFSTRPGVF